MIALAVMVFPGTQTLPLFAAQARGFFEHRGLDVELLPAPNSDEQRAGLAAGRYPIVHGAADQCVALAASGVDAVIVAGGDNGFNHLFVQSGIARIEELRGRTLAADAAGTGWSFVLYEMLKQHGLARTDYEVREVGAPFRRFAAMRDDALAAAILNPPFAIHARREGFRDLGPVVDAIGPYLGTVPYVLRSWARANAETLAAYLAAAIEGLRWITNLDNRQAAVELIAKRLDIDAAAALEILATARHDTAGLHLDAGFSLSGLKTVLRLRAAADPRPLAPPERYFDLSYWRRAIASL